MKMLAPCMKLRKIIRQDMFNHDGCTFTGSFQKKCQKDSVPPSLKYFMSMLLNGASLKDQDTLSCLTIYQMVLYNCKKKSSSSVVHTRHTLTR